MTYDDIRAERDRERARADKAEEALKWERRRWNRVAGELLERLVGHPITTMDLGPNVFREMAKAKLESKA